jgi:uncharacterized membrane protein
MSETATRPKARIESLSDIVFGLALSIGALSLVGTPPTDTSSLFYDIFTFGFSFLILISVWIRYTRIMSALPLENRRTMGLNIILLFCVSIEPYLFRFLDLKNSVNDPLAGPGSAAYAVDLGMIMMILGFFTFLLADEEKRLVPNTMIRVFRSQSYVQMLSGAIFFVTAFPIFYEISLYGSPLRFDIWFFPLIVVWVRRGWFRVNASRKHDAM